MAFSSVFQDSLCWSWRTGRHCRVRFASGRVHLLLVRVHLNLNGLGGAQPSSPPPTIRPRCCTSHNPCRAAGAPDGCLRSPNSPGNMGEPGVYARFLCGSIRRAVSMQADAVAALVRVKAVVGTELRCLSAGVLQLSSSLPCTMAKGSIHPRTIR